MQAWPKLSESETYVECNKSVEIALEVLDNLIRYHETYGVFAKIFEFYFSINLRSKSLNEILGINVSLTYNFGLILCY